jgi:hypothetical protein
MVVWDLGLTAVETMEIKKILEERFVEHRFMIFDYSAYPSYFNINVNAGEYAWKPVIIDLSKDMFPSCRWVFWMDSGNVVHEPLHKVREILDKNYLYSPKSLDTIEKWTHPKTLHFFNISSSDPLLQKAPRNGAAIAFDRTIDWVQLLLKKWSLGAQIPDCICPSGSSRENHRQDQAVFTLLYYHYLDLHLFSDEYPDVTYTQGLEEYNGFSIHNDVH